MRGVFEIIRGWGIVQHSPKNMQPANPSGDLTEKAALHEKRAIAPELLLLETAKEILGEVFNTTPSDVEEMIRIRMMEDDLV